MIVLTCRCIGMHFMYLFYLICIDWQVNKLCIKVLSKRVVEHNTTPAKYTGELFGVAYLYSQTGCSFPTDNNTARNEGLRKRWLKKLASLQMMIQQSSQLLLPSNKAYSKEVICNACTYAVILFRFVCLPQCPCVSFWMCLQDDDDSVKSESEDETRDSRGISRWYQVAEALLELKGLAILQGGEFKEFIREATQLWQEPSLNQTLLVSSY